MSALQELSTQLLVHIQPSGPGAQPPGGPAAPPSGPGERLEAQEKVHVIWNRLKLLLREVNVDLEELERRLAEFHEREDCILYASCFDANAGLFEVRGQNGAV